MNDKNFLECAFALSFVYFAVEQVLLVYFVINNGLNPFGIYALSFGFNLLGMLFCLKEVMRNE